MILIADSGSTKTDWVLLDEKNRFRYQTIGYNPFFLDSENIYRSVNEKLANHFDASLVSHVYFYGAGCLASDKTDIVNSALTRCFSKASVNVGHDMLAAARALLGNEPGFAAILGTGSNTCIYDGQKVTKNIDSLGYIIGDEGSGTYIGRKLLREYMRGFLPPELHKKFEEKYRLKPTDIFHKLYNEPLPNRFLASFSMFAHENQEDPFIRNIVFEAFGDFFKNLVCKYDGYNEYSFNCIGSIGYIFRDLLKVVAEFHGMRLGRIIHSPIDDLVNYHITNS